MFDYVHDHQKQSNATCLTGFEFDFVQLYTPGSIAGNTAMKYLQLTSSRLQNSLSFSRDVKHYRCKQEVNK